MVTDPEPVPARGTDSDEKVDVKTMAEKYSGTSSSPVATTARDKPLDRYGVFSRSAAEAFGAFVLVLGGVAVSMFGGQTGIPGALAFGLLFIAAIIAVGHVSGGHFNPALTLGFAVAGRLSWKDVLPYVVAQVIGGAAAMGLLWVVLSGGPAQIVEQIEGLFGSVSNGYGANSPSQFPLTSVLLLEVILTAVLAGVYLGATGARANKALAPFAAGLTYAAFIQVSLPVSGGGLNPARSTATVLFADAAAAGQLWLFWVAPLAGAVIAGLIYRSFEPAAGTGAAAGKSTTSAGTAATAGSATAGTAAAGTTTTDAADVDRTNEGSTADPEVRANDDVESGPGATKEADAADQPADEDEARNFFDRKDRK
ncbi:MIP/aquaporin family protein [Arthrobacter pigmenti]